MKKTQSTKIRFYDEVPAIVRPELEKRLSPYEFLLPDWCTHVWVGWSSEEDDGSVAEIEVHYDYRWAKITVYANWLEQTEDTKLECLVHELIHIAVAPLSDYASDTVSSLIPDEEDSKYKEMAVAMMSERRESVTQDLTRIIMRQPSMRGING